MTESGHKAVLIGTVVAGAAMAACATGGLAWVVGAVAGGVLGNVSDRVAGRILSAAKDRVAGLSGLPENHDLAKGVRTAQMQALEALVRDFRNLHPAAGAVFFTRALDFCARTIGRCADPEVKLNIEVTEPLGATIEGILAEPAHDGHAGRRAAAIAGFAEDKVLEELTVQLGGAALPNGFEAHFRDGQGEEHPRFLDRFGAHLAEQIKNNQPFHAVLTTGQLARIEGLAFDAAEMLHRLEGRFGRIANELCEFRLLVDRLTQDLSLSETQKQSLVAEMRTVKASHQGTVELVGGFLETMIGRKVPFEQFPATLFRIARDWQAAGERIDTLSISQNLSPRVVALRGRAKAEHTAGRLDAAETTLAEIAHVERDSLSRLEAHQREVQRELELRRRGLAETYAAQAAVAKARLRYREAATLHAEAAALVAFDDAVAWRHTLEAAAALSDLGRNFGDNKALEEAIAAYGRALAITSRERAPLDWAGTQNNLGIAIAALGEREGNSARLEQAVQTFRAALGERARGRAPLDWATTQNNLGNALWTLGRREEGTARLEQAVKAYRAALEERARGRAPLDWATTQNNLGNALVALSDRAGDTGQLEEAVSAYRAALEERTRERVPLDWATTQNNLGAALWALGEREAGTARLAEAVAAYRAALEVRTRERVPLQWAATQNNLGGALSTLGEREAGTARLEEAVRAYRDALEERTRERVPLDWAGTQNNLGTALAALGEREAGTARLEEAVAAFRAALEERTRGRVLLAWAATQNNLGTALWALGEREAGTARLEEAVRAFRAVLKERTRYGVPFLWAQTMENVAVAEAAWAERTSDRARLHAAFAACEEALAEYRRGNAVFYIEKASRLRDRLATKLAGAA